MRLGALAPQQTPDQPGPATPIFYPPSKEFWFEIDAGSTVVFSYLVMCAARSQEVLQLKLGEEPRMGNQARWCGEQWFSMFLMLSDPLIQLLML